jgi:hypothetical protein
LSFQRNNLLRNAKQTRLLVPVGFCTLRFLPTGSSRSIADSQLLLAENSEEFSKIPLS